MEGAHLEVKNLKRIVADRVVLTDISFDLPPGEILFVRGPSGVGKSLLLRSISCLDKSQGGTLLLQGKPPDVVGYPQWRAQVTYVSQSRVNFKGTPAEFYFQAQQYAAQRGRPRGDLPNIVHELGLEQIALNQTWAELSGGQAQRVALAVAIALRPAVLLLDEPTSACDSEATRRVERVLKSCGSSLVWVTHDDSQPLRVGGRVLELPMGVVSELPKLLSRSSSEAASPARLETQQQSEQQQIRRSQPGYYAASSVTSEAYSGVPMLQIATK